MSNVFPVHFSFSFPAGHDPELMLLYYIVPTSEVGPASAGFWSYMLLDTSRDHLRTRPELPV